MSHLLYALESSDFVVTAELTPPKGTDLVNLMSKADQLKSHVVAINLTESPTAHMAMDPVAAGHLFLDRGIEPIVQMTSRDKNRLAIQSSILGACALGISNIVFMGGDSPASGDHPEARPVFDLTTPQLLEAACGLNEGRDFAGNPLSGVANIFPGAVTNPGAADPKAEIESMRRKVEAGARYFQTQAVYDVGEFEAYMHKANVREPVLAGIIPIKSVKMARYMNDHVPGVEIPDALIKKIADAGNDTDKIVQIGIDICANTIRSVRSISSGIHLMAVGWEEHIPEILVRSGLRAL